MKIAPTVGRVVLYHPSEGDPHFREMNPEYAATVAFVNQKGDNYSVNLSVSKADGVVVGRVMVPLVQPDDAKPEKGHWCEWMPYQIGQAQRTAEAEAASAPAVGGGAEVGTTEPQQDGPASSDGSGDIGDAEDRPE